MNLHPLAKRQQMVLKEGQYFVNKNDSMKGNWPYSLPKNAGLIY
jgi:hypothetical protein